MKNHLLIFALVATTTTTLSAQFSLGLQGGIHHSRYIYSEKPFIQGKSPKFFPGYHIGLVPALKIASGKVEVSAPISFVQRQFQMGQLLSAPSPKNRFQTLEINPRLGFFITPDLAIQAGIYTSFIFQEHFDSGDGNWAKVPSLVREQANNTLDFGLSGGLRYIIKRFSINGNLQYGFNALTNVIFTDGNGEPFETTGRNLAFQLGLGYTLFEKK